MRRRRNRRAQSTATVSLFPFLAVLICTFGVLIVLLVLVVKSASQIQNDQFAKKKAETQKQLEELQGRLELEQVRVQGLGAVRPKIVKRLQDQRHVRVHLTSEINKLQQEAELLARSIKRIEDDSKQIDNTEDLNQKVGELQRQLTQEQENLRRASEESQVMGRQLYSIVPHVGPNATQRRPIFIECTNDKLTIQPYGIELHLRDFVPPITSSNPLDAALTAVREYFIRYNLVDDQGFPYPLLVVRPDGPESYVLARRAMSNWTDEFGYELVSADKELDFGESDEQLKQTILDAITEAKLNQTRLALRARQAAPIAMKMAAQSVGLRASSQFGGFVSEERGRAATTSTDHDPTGSWPQDSPESSQNAKRGPESIQHDSNPAESNRSAPKSIAAERGSGWALPSRAPGATGYLRPVKIYCGTDEMIIESSQGDGDRKRIPFGDSSEQAVIQLVDALWTKIDSWGMAGVNGYWKPQLKIVVLPGAERRFGEIELLLHNSGLEVEGIQ